MEQHYSKYSEGQGSGGAVSFAFNHLMSASAHWWPRCLTHIPLSSHSEEPPC